MKIKDITKISLFTTLIIIGTFIKIPTPIVPMTLQVLFVLLSSVVLERKQSIIVTILYTIIGLLGIPVFSKGGGFWYILEPTFGYILGFILCSYLIPTLKNYVNIFISLILGILSIYLLGVGYMFILSNYIIDSPISLNVILLSGFLIPLPNDLLSALIVLIIYSRYKKIRVY